MKYLRVFLLLLQIYNIHSSNFISCQYTYHHSEVLGIVYQCIVDSSLEFDAKNQEVVANYNPINNQVASFVANYKYLEYFPMGLNRIFRNLQIIHLRRNSIKTVNYRDLSPFPELKELDLAYNQIEILDDLFFRASPKLIFLCLSRNKIFHIDSQVFDGLHNLIYLHLYANTCIDQDANADRNEVLNVIKETKRICMDQNYLNLNRKMEQLENASRTRQPSEMQRIINNFEQEFNNSSLANVWIMRERLNNMKIRAS